MSALIHDFTDGPLPTNRDVLDGKAHVYEVELGAGDSHGFSIYPPPDFGLRLDIDGSRVRVYIERCGT